MESRQNTHNLENLPPMLRQYLEYKERHPEALLFFQVGDFYELFFDDAVTTAKLLGLTLTSRDKNAEKPIPMCGVPIAVIDTYIAKLVSSGRSVAIVRQFGDPNARKGMMERKLERIITPGVQVLGAESKSREENFLAAIFVSAVGEEFSIAYADVRTGKIRVRDGLDREGLLAELKIVDPTEIVLPREFEGKKFDRRSNWIRDVELISDKSAIVFRTFERVEAGRLKDVNGYVSLSEVAKRAVHLLVGYVDEATVGERVQFLLVEEDSHQDELIMDSGTRKHLELLSNMRDGSSHGTLLGVIDTTKTPHGGRLIREWIVRPLRSLDKIEQRLDAVQALVSKQRDLRGELSQKLELISDLERIATRLELSAASPRELAALRDSLSAIRDVRLSLGSVASELPSLLAMLYGGLVFDSEILRDLETTLTDSPPISLVDGGIIRGGVNPDLDRLRDIRANGKNWIAALENTEKERTGINSLKIRFNSVFGYYIEITKANLDKVPADYIRKQTTANGERYVTEALKTQEEEILNAESREHKLERELFEGLIQRIKPFSVALRELSLNLAMLDVLMSLAEVCELHGYKRPEINDSRNLSIQSGKHPVLAATLRHDFVPNHLEFEETSRQVLLLTGPNMGGKSTYLRQAALITILAQMGSFVPAETVSLGLVDRIFTRIGAADNMMEGESTFMVEMREAAFILANATNRSLLLVDELGRGTATQDGLSLAQATLEWMVERIGARTLFATHFHELTELEGTLSGLVNLSVGSKEIEGQIIFTHSICEGPANKSYGLEVAKLAGLPGDLTIRAREIMENHLQNSSETGKPQSNFQLDMFSAPRARESVRVIEKVVEPADYKKYKGVVEHIVNTDVNSMTPLEALNLLAKVKAASVKQDA
jgi:DNA mismatch repair protein MutS